MRHVFLLAVMLASANPVAAADAMNVSCAEMVRLTGDAYPCEDFPTLKVTKAQYETAQRSHAKRLCVAEWKAKYGHCYGQGVKYLIGEAPKECYQNSKPACDPVEETADDPKAGTVKLW